MKKPRKARSPLKTLPAAYSTSYVPVKLNGLYTTQHIYRLEREGRIPPLHRRRRGCRAYLGPEHYAVLGFAPPTKPEAA